jgi:mannose-6-phosphate isomerase-like protein (cupin superfamily)
MRVMSNSVAELIPEFGILSGRWAQYDGLGDVPFGAMWLVVPPGGRADTDRHAERELMVVLRGSADISASGCTQTLQAGAAVLLDSEEAHILANSSADEPLVALSLYWLPAHDEEPAHAV